MNPIRIGTSGWSYDDWVGPFYAPGAAGDYLCCYCRHFDVVEDSGMQWGVSSDAR